MAYTSTLVNVVLQNSSIHQNCALCMGSYTCSDYRYLLHLTIQGNVDVQ